MCPPVGLASNEHESNSTDAAVALLSLASSESMVRHARVARVVSSLHLYAAPLNSAGTPASIQICHARNRKTGGRLLCEAERGYAPLPPR